MLSNWFADHLYISDFLIICHRSLCPFTGTTCLEGNIYNAVRSGLVPPFFGCTAPTHRVSNLASSLTSNPSISASISPLLWCYILTHLASGLHYISKPVMMRKRWVHSLMKEQAGRILAPNSPPLSGDLEKKMYSFVLLCKRSQVHFGMHLRVTWSHLNIKKPSNIRISSFQSFTTREHNR